MSGEGNANPHIFQRSGERLWTASDEDEDVHDPIDDREIFDILLILYTYNACLNKQLADKERVAAALENSQLLEVVNQCLSTKSL
ncbi:hypothetical protein NHX12_022273 [Muraenolepis orangiensis]|uniref:Uncharacterized protein n=1 Tax=Muraenolepis orangiensis TaxID=630683 RepID=A0A9Q0ITC3_9TELE|nr:hypothetical protein NHX12_022273 [Muraenolepis orangiensis]